MGKEQTVTSLRVDPELWKKAKIQAIEEGMTLAEVVEHALQDWIEKQARKGGK
jgi:predicted HicB family RNase H-like nuclease